MSVVLVDCHLIAGKRGRRPTLRINARGVVIGIAGDDCPSPEGNKLAKHREKKGRAGAEEREISANSFRSAAKGPGGGSFFLFPPNGRRVAWH